MRNCFFLSIAAVSAAAFVLAQPPLRVAGQARQQAIVSPEVQADCKITFRLAAPEASDVQLSVGEWKPKTYPLAKGQDGVWSVTIGPVEPEIYMYAFLVEGVRVGDSVVEVPGTPPRFDELQNVPHGSFTVHTYFARGQDRQRGLYIYVPPQYNTEPNRKFPVLYLWHADGSESDWISKGRTNVILDNLIAQKRAAPMIVVMPNNRVAGDTTSLGSSAVLGKELQADIIPLVEKNYRALSDRNNRAMAGLSFGGGTTFNVGMNRLDIFGYLGVFSAGVFGGSTPRPGNSGYGHYEPEKIAPDIYQNLVSPAKKLKVFYMSVGTDDPRVPFQKAALADFQQHGIEPVFKTFAGGHEWSVWRHSLADFATMLFK
jgi:enterochelin esterase-like enzyme